MRFALSAEQHAFAAAIDASLAAADVPDAARRWAAGDPSAGFRIWAGLADLGVTGLRVPESLGGAGGSALDLAVAAERLGYAGVPGPYLDTVALAPVLLRDLDPALLTEIAKGTARVGVAAPPGTPFALDADTATHLFVLSGQTVHRARPGRGVESVDPVRRLAALTPLDAVGRAPGDALDDVTLATAAWLTGAGQRLLDETVAYVRARRQFGRVIGEYQAVKHALADVKVGLDFTRPLVHGAAREHDAGGGGREISAAKVLAGTSALRAARTALQLHGAIGYTRELDLSRWILAVRALVAAWGTPAHHRRRVLGAV
ncbi:acyl-CoA dehydrogenase family protein [Cryptosporangium phraense]|uniref:Acyl-CoA dehydrogenase n=1 Tax=Cryptosporangium phraense TaxID=2593070 RepID=A0A545ATN4_9ACTN|nr:acyl-CoA dehydrogenase family protein [Cryptosporangium phraense]TQS44698.1 acyl-CoA dehydrogenase [Cryptosporangium phraense]